MTVDCSNINNLIYENKRLRRELEEATNILDAIKHGDVDALFISDQVYMLHGADHIYRALIEEMQEGCATISSSGVITFCNRNFANLLDIPLDRVIGCSFKDFLIEHDWNSFSFFLTARGGMFKAECLLKYRPVILSASTLCVDDDTLACLVVTDLTEHKRTEQFIKMVLDQATEPIIACDTYGQIVQANPAATTIFETSLVGEHFDNAIELTLVSTGVRLTLNEMMTLDSSCTPEVHYWQKDGTRLTLLANASRFISSQRNAIGCVVTLTDITDKYLFAAEMARLDRLDIIGEVAAGIGHEVRNPLTTVRGYLQLFTYNSAYTAEHPRMQLMIEELDRANSIITEFLSLAKNKKIELIHGDLCDTIETLFPLLQADAFRLGHQIELELSSRERVAYDDKEIRQLIINLVRNGLEAMPFPGLVKIKTYYENGLVTLAVEDTGTGIPRDFIDKIGTPFQTSKETGTGLGMAVCYRIAEAHDAKIHFDTSSKGTTFYVRFKPYEL